VPVDAIGVNPANRSRGRQVGGMGAGQPGVYCVGSTCREYVGEYIGRESVFARRTRFEGRGASLET
jgi:hypothetical protein